MKRTKKKHTEQSTLAYLWHFNNEFYYFPCWAGHLKASSVLLRYTSNTEHRPKYQTHAKGKKILLKAVLCTLYMKPYNIHERICLVRIFWYKWSSGSDLQKESRTDHCSRRVLNFVFLRRLAEFLIETHICKQLLYHIFQESLL